MPFGFDPLENLRLQAEECARLSSTVRDPFIQSHLKSIADACLLVVEDLERKAAATRAAA